MLPLAAFFSIILPLVFYLAFYKRNKGEGLSVILFYCILSILTEGAFGFLTHWGIDKYYIFASFTIIEFTIFSFFFYRFLKNKMKYAPIVGGILFYIIALGNMVIRKSDTFDSLPASVEAILLIIYCILFLYEQIKDPSIMFVYYTKKFWFVTALLLYFSSTLFLFLYAASFTKQERNNYWSINNIFEILKHLLFCVSLLLKKNITRYPPLETLNTDM